MSIARYTSIGSALVVAMILTRLLDEDVYGAYRKLWLIYAILGPALINSLAGTLYYRGGDKNRDSAIAANMFLGAVYGLGTGALAWFFAPFWAGQLNVPELVDGFRMFAPYMILAVFAGIAEPLFVVLHRKKWLLGYSLSYNFVEAALIVVPFAMGLPVQQVVLIMSIGPALRTLFILILGFSQMKRVPGLKDVGRELPVSFKYGVGILILSVAGVAAAEADKWVIGSYFESDALFAIYVIGAKKIPFIIALTSAVSASIVSEYAARLRQGDVDGAMQEARGASVRLSLIIIPVVAWLFVYAEEVMVLLFGKYEASAPIFRIYILTVLSQLIFPQSIALGAGRSDVNARFGVVEVVVNITLSIILVMWIGLKGPAIATLIGHFFFTGMMLWFCWKTFQIKPSAFFPGKKSVGLLWSLPAVVIAAFLLKYTFVFGWAGFAIAGVVTGLIVLISLKRSARPEKVQ